MANWNLPSLSDLYGNFLDYLKDRDLDLAKGLDPASVTVTSPVSGMVRFNSAQSRWEKFDGTSWNPAATTYAINVATAVKWATGRTITLTGDATGASGAFDGSANLSFSLTLANSGVTAGTYGASSTRRVPIITVDGKGRVTSASAYTLGTMAAQAANNVSITGGSITGTNITVKGSVSPTPTVEGRAEWDTDHDQLKIGDGSGTKTISPDNVAATLTNKTLGSGTKVTASIAVNGQTVTIQNLGFLAGVGASIQAQLNNLSNAQFPSGTRMLFQQTTAPTGWTKDTTHNNKALRLVNGSVGSGGSVSFTTAFSNRSTEATEAGGQVLGSGLAESQLAAHRHTYNMAKSRDAAPSVNTVSRFGYATDNENQRNNISASMATTGLGYLHSHSFLPSSHKHELGLSVQYVDTIIAVKA